MDGMLSQDEINALLSGMDLSGDTPPEIPEDLLATDTSQSSMPSNNGYFAGAGFVFGEDEILIEMTDSEGKTPQKTVLKRGKR